MMWHRPGPGAFVGAAAVRREGLPGPVRRAGVRAGGRRRRPALHSSASQARPDKPG